MFTLTLHFGLFLVSFNNFISQCTSAFKLELMLYYIRVIFNIFYRNVDYIIDILENKENEHRLLWVSSVLSWFASLDKAFCNLFCNPQTRSLRDLPTRIEAVNHSSNSTMAFTKKKKKKKRKKKVNYLNYTQKRPNFACDNYIFPKTRRNKNKQWTHSTPVNSIEDKIPERCENSSVDYRINYEQLCYSLQ